jgi:predicted  nucleic acid-binding Zn-ribbon protein
MEQTAFSPTADPIPPDSMEEARARLEEIKLEKKELNLEKKQVSEEMRELRAEYSTDTGKRATRGKGVGALISDDLGRAAKKVASVRNSYDRKGLAIELEPLEERRAAIEEELIALDAEKLEIEKWMSAQKSGTGKSTRKETTPASSPAATDTDARIAQLEQLASLKERGILTDEEFLAEKQRILAGHH